MNYKEMIGLTGKRQRGFNIMIQHLDSRQQPPLIVETGCARQEDNYSGDGMSTLIFDSYVNEHGGEFHTVDIDPANVEFSQSQVKGNTGVHCGDSVLFLHNLNNLLLAQARTIDLLYLDSLDYFPEQELESSLHHIYELCAIRPSLKTDAMIVVDDNFYENGKLKGKGKFMFEFMKKIGCPCVLQDYQCIWVLK
jgi:hypothetical protein